MQDPEPRQERVPEEQFEDLDKQGHAARLGIWIFLGSETLLFGALFALYVAYRTLYAEEFVAGVRHNDLAIGTINTFVLITSSFTVAMAVHAARNHRARRVLLWLGLTVALAAVFLVLKGVEYAHHFDEGIYPGSRYRFEELDTSGAKLFFTLYFFMTGLHALHVVGGMVALVAIGAVHRRRPYDARYYVPLDAGALYWHLVDVVWIFLWPLLYLTR